MPEYAKATGPTDGGTASLADRIGVWMVAIPERVKSVRQEVHRTAVTRDAVVDSDAIGRPGRTSRHRVILDKTLCVCCLWPWTNVFGTVDEIGVCGVECTFADKSTEITVLQIDASLHHPTKPIH